MARLQLGLEGLAGYEHYEGPIVEQGSLVVTEHREVWHWETGETASLPFVSVMTRRGRRHHALEGLLGLRDADERRARGLARAARER